MHLTGIELWLHLQVLKRFVVCVHHNLFFDQVAVPLTEQCPAFHSRALGAFVLLHSISCYKMLLVKVGNPLMMHVVIKLDQWHDQIHQF